VLPGDTVVQDWPVEEAAGPGPEDADTVAHLYRRILRGAYGSVPSFLLAFAPAVSSNAAGGTPRRPTAARAAASPPGSSARSSSRGAAPRGARRSQRAGQRATHPPEDLRPAGLDRELVVLFTVIQQQRARPAPTVTARLCAAGMGGSGPAALDRGEPANRSSFSMFA
jgi:hypothetical protein